MALTFADTHNMIAYLTKSDASEGFDQIIDFLNASSIIKKVNDVIPLQALVNKKKVIITEATIREALRLDDADSIDCLPNEEIFTKLSRMGYEKPSTKLTFYKAFFSPQWMFLIHTILQCMSAKRTSWNEFSSSMALAVICLSTRARKGYSGVETPLFKGMIVAQQADEELPSTSRVLPTSPQSPIDEPSSPPQQRQPSQLTHDAKILMDLLHTLLETCTTLTEKVEALEQDKVAQTLEIIKLKERVKKLERKNKLKVSSGYYCCCYHYCAAATITAAIITTATNAARRRKGVVIRDPKETATPSIIIHSEPKSKDKGKWIMVEEPKPLKKQARIEQDEAYERELKNRWKKKDIRVLKRASESQAEKATKKQKLDEEVEELKKHLQIVPNDEDDVYTEATPLIRKVTVVDYEIYTENNKPYYKIIRADGSP
nr:hypothetical protein [Tanacetum cinerariifolium]